MPGSSDHSDDEYDADDLGQDPIPMDVTEWDFVHSTSNISLHNYIYFTVFTVWKILLPLYSIDPRKSWNINFSLILIEAFLI